MVNNQNVLFSKGADVFATNCNSTAFVGYDVQVNGANSSSGIYSGVRAVVVNPGAENRGVYGFAATGTKNYGVYGDIVGNSSGGTIDNYAVYSNGDFFNAGGSYGPSETALKQNIQPLQNALSTLNKINASSFNYNIANFPTIHLPADLEYGVIAENIDTVLPELVKNITQPAVYDSLGGIIHPAVTFKGVNYTELIPWLIAGVNELDGIVKTKDSQLATQDSIINSLINRLTLVENCLDSSNICSNNINANRTTNTTTVTLNNAKSIILDQNNPNPFKETTFITYNIPDDVKSATMVFYDMNGRMIKEVNINERGESQLQVYGSDLSTGIYTYTLVVDGKVHASKKMVKN